MSSKGTKRSDKQMRQNFYYFSLMLALGDIDHPPERVYLQKHICTAFKQLLLSARLYTR